MSSQALRVVLAVSISALCLSVCACASGPANTPTPIVTVKTVCLPLKAYSAEEQKAVAAELEALPAGSHVAAFVADYGAMRAADRACLGSTP